MRRLNYYVFPATGHEIPVAGTVTDLLESIPYLLMSGVIPPLHVINDMLRRGIDDAGMSGGCRWEPLELDELEWEEVRAALEARSRPCRYVPPPDWVKGFEDWYVWLFDFLYGVPAHEHRRLHEQDAELAQAIALAVAEDDHERVLELHVQRTRVNEELADFMMTHLHRRR